MKKKEHPKRHIIPLRANPRTCPARIMPGPLQLFVRPMQPFTRPLEAAFARRYTKAGSWARWLVAFDALAVATLVTVAVIFASVVLLPPPAPLRLSVEASAAEVRAADLVGFTIHYENRGKSPLIDAQLALTLPNDFHVTAVDVPGAPVDLVATHNVVSLGAIPSGGNGTVRVSGHVLQPVSTEGALRLDATFFDDDGSSPIPHADASAEVRVSGSALSLRWAGAPVPALQREGRVLQTLVVENTGAAAIEGLRVAVGELLIAEFEAALAAGDSIVVGEYDAERLGSTLAAGEVVLARLEPKTIERNSEGPAVDEVIAEVRDGMLEVRARISFGGLGRYRLEPRFFPKPWSAVDVSGLAADAEAEGIVGDVVETGPEKVEVVYLIPLKEGADTSNLTMRVVASSCFVDSDNCAWSSSVRVPVAPPGPVLSAELHYYTTEGEQLGRGPLPPRVEEKTEYWLIAQIATAGRTIADAELVATFAPDVVWSGKASTAIVGAGSPTGLTTLHWRLGEVTAPVDAPSTAAFGMAYRPGTDAVGREPSLVESLVLRGRDAETGEPVELRLGPFTTAVPHDVRAVERGTRVEPALE